MAGVSDEMRVRGLKICKDFLAGAWNQIEPKDFIIERIKGGLSNMMYRCVLPKHLSVEGEEPREVILRMYGQIIQENPETVVTDSVIFGLLAEKNLGPGLHGVFTGGRVEEYVQSKPLTTRQLRDRNVSLECARVMARIHKLRMPLIKEPRWLFDVITRYLDDAQNNLSFSACAEADREKLKKILSYGLASEFKCLKNILREVDSPVLFCHNDMQEGNILFLEGVEGNDRGWTLLPIDFEYASYNYRGFDIANHLCEWCYDYHVDHPPYYSADINLFPSREEQLDYIRTYLEVFSPGEDQNQKEVEESILKEIQAFTLASDFMWGVWSLVQVQISDINFGYLDYALTRLEAYYIHKKQLLDAYPVITNGV